MIKIIFVLNSHKTRITTPLETLLLVLSIKFDFIYNHHSLFYRYTFISLIILFTLINYVDLSEFLIFVSSSKVISRAKKYIAAELNAYLYLLPPTILN